MTNVLVIAAPVAADVSQVATFNGYGSGTNLFSQPLDTAVSSTGNVYVVDSGNNQIQEFDSSGNFITKWGTSGSGNGQFSSPSSIAIDSSNNIYVADSGNHRIQKFNSSGTYITQFGSSGGGAGQFLGLAGITVDSSANVYAVDNGWDTVQKFTSTGTYTATYAGAGSGNGQLTSPNGIDVDSSGNFYVADTGDNRIEKFNPSGAYVAAWTAWDVGQLFSIPRGVAVDSSGNVYVSDTGHGEVVKLNSSGVFLSLIGASGSGSCDGQFSGNEGLAVGSSGSVYVADTGNNRVVALNSSGVFVANWGGNGTGGLSFSSPEGITTDSSGNVYVVDSNNNRIGKFSGGGVLQSTWGGTSGGCTDNEHFTTPLDAAVSTTGYVYVPDNGGDRVQKFDTNGNFQLSWDGHDAPTGQMHFPTGIAVDASGNVYVADGASSSIEKFTSAGVFVSAFGTSSNFIVVGGVAVDSAGNVWVSDSEYKNVQEWNPTTGTLIKSFDGSATSAGKLNEPGGLALDSFGNIFVADNNNNRIVEFNSSGGLITTWGTYGSGTMQFKNPHDVAVDSSGNVFVADSGNGRVVKFHLTGAPTPTITSSSPPSPGNTTTPKLIGTSEAGSIVKIYPNSSCTGSPVVTGDATIFASPGLAVTVTPNTTNTFYALAIDSAGASACSTGFTYVENQAPPAAPSVTSVTPASPANNNTPKIIGTAAAGSTVKIYTDSACSALLASGTAATFASPGITVTVADNTVTTFYATASNTNGPSSCSAASSSYTEDSAAPAAPSITSSSPASPSSNSSPKMIGTAEAGSTVGFYLTSNCSGSPVATGTAAAFASPGITVPVTANTTNSVRATATDVAGNKSPCSAAFTYVHDSVAPATPSLGSIPGSPSSNDHPFLVGVAEAGSTVKIYTSSSCTGTPTTSGIAATYQSTGFQVAVTDNTTTTFYASATDAVGNVSPCSTGLAYTENSTTPTTPTITSSSPASPADNTTPLLKGTADPNTTITIYQFSPTCSANIAGSGTSAAFTTTGIAVTVTNDSIYTFYAKATNNVNTVSPCSQGFTYHDEHTIPFTPTVDSITPEAPISAPVNYNTPIVNGTAAIASTVKLYTDYQCTSAVAGTGIADSSFHFSIPVTVPDDSTTTFYATASNSKGTSACSSSSDTYAEKSTPPSPPTWFLTSPVIGNTTTKLIGGNGAANSTVNIYTQSTCTGMPVASGPSTPSFSIHVTVPSNSVTTFYASTTDAAGNVSGCSTSGLTYIEDEIAPSTPTITTAYPFGNPSSATSTRLEGTGDLSGTYVQIYKGSGCPGGVNAWYQTDTVTKFTSSTDGIAVFVPANTSQIFSANEIDAAGNVSGCSADFTYVNDSTAPATPSITSSSPASPSTSNAPRLIGSAEAGSTVKVYTTTACSGPPIATGTAAEFASPGIAVSITSNTTTTFKVTATDAAGNVSSCSSGLTYSDDATAPAAPTISSSSPASPANNNGPKLVGTSEAGSTVSIYTNSNCIGAPVKTGSASAFASPGLAVSVGDNTSTTYYATATDGSGNVSTCSSGFTYTEDSIAPATPTISSSSPASGSNNNAPKLIGSAAAGSTVKIYTTSDCSGSATASGTAAAFASPGITVSVTDNTTTTFYATATDTALNASPCSTGLSYAEVSPAAAPTISSSSPASPANNNSPKLIGTADAGSTVKIYTSSDCSGSPVATGTAAAFASPGIAVSVTDNTTTTFKATATNASNVASACSTGLTYVEDSASPTAPSIASSNPASPANNNAPKLIGTAEAGSTVKIFTTSDCSGTPTATGTAAAFASPGLSVSVLDNTTTTFYAIATDVAANASSCSTGLTYIEDSTAPSAPSITSSNPASPANNASPKLIGSAAAGSTVKIFTTSDCSGSPVATGTAAAFASPGIGVTVAANSTTAFRATATDAASNHSSCSSPFSYTMSTATDTTKPTVTLTTPPNGAHYLLNQVVSAVFSCSDNVAIKTCAGTVANGGHIGTAVVGIHAFTVTATDTSNNQTVVTIHYTVVYPFAWGTGLVVPPSLNGRKSATTAKIFFSLGGNRGLTVFNGLAKSIPINCTTHAAIGTAATTGVSAFKWNATKKQYFINWTIPTAWKNTCRQLVISVKDGTAHALLFHFT